MKTLKTILVLLLVITSLSMFSQGCEDPGEGDGINIFGYIQPQFEQELNGVNSDYNTYLEDNHSGFFFNRARLGVMGNVPYDFSYYFILEYAPAAGFGICDAFLSYNRFKPYASVAFGQFKTPFGAEQLQGCHKLYTIDRSMVSSNVGAPIRDMGIIVSGNTGDLFSSSSSEDEEGETFLKLGWQLAYQNGLGRDLISREESLVSLPEQYKQFAGRFTANVLDIFTLGTSYKSVKATPTTENAVNEFDKRTRMGFDAKVEYMNFILMGEFLSGKDEGTVEVVTGEGCGATTSYVPGSDEKDGYYFTALYKTPWNLEPVIKYETFDPSLNTDDDMVSRTTFGVNYFFNEWTRLQVNYQYNNKEVPYAWNEAYQDMLQVQLQIVIK